MRMLVFGVLVAAAAVVALLLHWPPTRLLALLIGLVMIASQLPRRPGRER